MAWTDSSKFRWIIIQTMEKVCNWKGRKFHFSLSFAVPDYLTGRRSGIFFQSWKDMITNGLHLVVSMRLHILDVPAGDYIFKVRYKKDVFDTEYKFFSIPIHILPPWYQSLWAYLLYILLIVALCGLFVSFTS